jgi:hypothetical protein
MTARTLVLATAVGSAVLLGGGSPAAQASVPKNAVWASSKNFGIWYDGSFDLYNNQWNAARGSRQIIWAYSFRRWGVQSTQPGTTSVKSYPSVQENLNYPRVSSLRRLSSYFRQSMPKARDFDAEAAYDLWLFDGKNEVEVMVWVDDHGQRPAGNVVTHLDMYGRRYALWVDQSTSNYTFRLEGKQLTSGSIHLLKMLQWLTQHQYLNVNDTLWQVNFGWEICSTNRVPLDFTVTDYSLTLRS